MAKFRWSEIFLSIEAEAIHTGTATIYVRFGGCNFKCPGFNNPTMDLGERGYAPLSFLPKDYTSLQELPLITVGCDSQYSVNPAFKHLWITGTEDDIVRELHEILPYNSFLHPKTGKRYSLSLTGGEPSLHFKQIPALLNHPGMAECKHIIFETNCAAELSWDTVGQINQWLCADPERKWTWSNSPKLRHSGETWEEAIRPDIAARQRAVTGLQGHNQMEQYFKFVVNPTQVDFDEVTQAMEEYHAAGIPRDVDVWMMPAACISEQQDETAAKVARMCIEEGRRFCYRVQMIFGNGIGT